MHALKNSELFSRNGWNDATFSTDYGGSHWDSVLEMADQKNISRVFKVVINGTF